MSAMLAGQPATFSARRYRRVRHGALRALCAFVRVVLRAPSVVPDVVLRAQSVVPDAAPYQTSASQWTAWRAWCWSGLPQVTPSELQASPQVQTQPRIQKERERFDDRPASILNVHPYQAPSLQPSRTSPHSREWVLIWINRAVGNKIHRDWRVGVSDDGLLPSSPLPPTSPVIVQKDNAPLGNRSPCRP